MYFFLTTQSPSLSFSQGVLVMLFKRNMQFRNALFFTQWRSMKFRYVYNPVIDRRSNKFTIYQMRCWKLYKCSGIIQYNSGCLMGWNLHPQNYIADHSSIDSRDMSIVTVVGRAQFNLGWTSTELLYVSLVIDDINSTWKNWNGWMFRHII